MNKEGISKKLDIIHDGVVEQQARVQALIASNEQLVEACRVANSSLRDVRANGLAVGYFTDAVRYAVSAGIELTDSAMKRGDE